MTHLININNSEYVTVNHVIFNPTFKCNVGCPTCYLTSFEKKSQTPELSSIVWMRDWIKQCLTEDQVLCNQVSISVNTNELGSMGDLRTRSILRSLNEHQFERTDTDLNVTVSIGSWRDYIDDIIVANPTILSLSIDSYKTLDYIPQVINDLKSLPVWTSGFKPLINLNVLANKDFDPSWISEFMRLERLYGRGPLFHHMYVVMEKPPLGREYKGSSLESMKKLTSIMPQDRVSIDGCLTSCRDNGRVKNPCGEGINLLSVWPNGTLTGCPYATGELGRSVTTHRKFVDVVRDYRKLRLTMGKDFDKCKVPAAIKLL